MYYRPSSFKIFNTSREKAEKLCDKFSDIWKLYYVAINDLEKYKFYLIINSTSAGISNEDFYLPEKFFRWGGQFIVRSHKQMIPEDFDIAARRECDNLCWGVEYGSEKVRTHMQKQFSKADIDYCMQQMSRVGMH